MITLKQKRNMKKILFAAPLLAMAMVIGGCKLVSVRPRVRGRPLYASLRFGQRKLLLLPADILDQDALEVGEAALGCDHGGDAVRGPLDLGGDGWDEVDLVVGGQWNGHVTSRCDPRGNRLEITGGRSLSRS